MMIAAIAGWTLPVLALAAIGYTLLATLAVRRFARCPLPPPAIPEPVTLLKPLHGDEPCLATNLASFLDQDWPAAVQMVVGTNRLDDAALPVARALRGNVLIRAAAPPTGANAKIANLAHMLPAAAHDLLVMSDSDMAAPRDYLARVAGALAQPGTGAVTCAYRGRADAAGWSRFAAAGLSWQFAPGVVTSWALGLEQACMGSTIALRRATLERIGGFKAFADVLADDHAIGAGVRALGLRVRPVPGLVLIHGCTERSMGAVWRHELRWAATVRVLGLAAHVGTLLTHPLPLALLALPFEVPFAPVAGLVLIVAAFAARLTLIRAVDRWVGEPTAPGWWLPARDLFSFGVYVTSFFVQSVDWRGASLRMESHGRVSAEPEHP